jgi:hypothetical protein
VELNEFHWTDGWYFKRNDDGSVRIRKRTISTDEAPIIAEATIPALEWVSIASHCTAGGEPENYEKVKALVLPTKVAFCTRCPFAMHLHPTPPEAGNCPGYP